MRTQRVSPICFLLTFVNMKKTTCLLLICFIYLSKIDAQSLPDSILVAAYNQTLQTHWEELQRYWQKFNTPVKQEGHKLYSDYLKKESLSKENRAHYTMVLVNTLYPRCNGLFVSRKSELAYQINHKNFHNSPDTIDILISERRFKCLKRNTIGISVACRGDMGYIPDGRLVLDKNNAWVYISYHTLYAEALAREQLAIQRLKGLKQ